MDIPMVMVKRKNIKKEINNKNQYNMREKKQYETPATSLNRVQLESDICAGSEGQPIEKNEDRHVNINPQENGGSVDFTSGNYNNGWD